MRLAAFLFALLPLLASDYSTFVGDSYPYNVSALATGADGSTFVTGSRQLTPTATDIFLVKLDPAGNLVFRKTLGGKGSDAASAIALDAEGNIYVAGSTTSPDFPLSRALQTMVSAGGSGFIVKFSPDGGTILYATYFGGTLGPSSIAALATDSTGDLYLTGTSAASDFSVTPGLPDGRSKVAFPNYQGAFVAKISATGDKLLYGALIVGATLPADAASGTCRNGNASRLTGGAGIAVDTAGNAYIAGNTSTVDLPATSGAFLQQGVGAFVAKIGAGGSGLAYLTYLDASDNCSFAEDALLSIAVDAAGNAYLAGETNDPSFPVTSGTVQPQFGGAGTFGGTNGDAFIAKMKPDGSGLAWSTFLGGSDADSAHAIALDSSGNVWVTGTTASSHFPNADGWSSGTEFLAGLNPPASSLIYSARYPKGSVAQGVAVDPDGLVHVAGVGGVSATISPTGPPAPRIFGVINTAGDSVAPIHASYRPPLAGIIAPGELITIYGPHIGPPASVQGRFDGAGFLPTTLGSITLSIGGVEAPLLYVSDSQVDAVVPMGTPTGPTSIQITSATAHTPDFPTIAVEAAPMIFLNPDGSAAALNQDGTVNSLTNRAAGGSILTIWVSGTGIDFRSAHPPLADGQVASVADSECACQIQSGSTTSFPSVRYSGAAPGTVAGVIQINFVVPDGLDEFTLTVNGAATTAYAWASPSFPF